MGSHKPLILAPAGDTASFLAALAAGADAAYLGLKSFSARMEAPNFSITELAVLKELAEQEKCRLFVAMNSILK
ncbi:U32 family peptidase, partial [Thermodesulfobacteriota bacterium]